MKLYKLTEKGELDNLNKIEFSNTDVYLVDDNKTIYIWIGSNVSLNMKDLAVKSARKLNKNKGGSAKLILIDENREYGSFLALMDDLKKGISLDGIYERRAEFTFEEPGQLKVSENMNLNDSEPDLIKWLNQLKQYRKIETKSAQSDEIDYDDLKEIIGVAAYFLSINQLTYDELCWMLAEKQLIIWHGDKSVTEKMIKEKAAQIFSSSSTYDELCWLIAELNILMEKGLL